MQAINHVATALLIKKAFPKAPLFGLIIGTEAVELLWIALNIAGVEMTTIDSPMHSVADVHLVHMPYSHSILFNILIALGIGLLIFWRGGKAATITAVAVMLAIISHIILDLLVHAPDIALWPQADAPLLGTGLYAHAPIIALAIESLWGVFCWWVYRGNWKMLLVILLFALMSIPIYSPVINMGEGALSGRSDLFAYFVLLQILVASLTIYVFAKGPNNNVRP